MYEGLTLSFQARGFKRFFDHNLMVKTGFQVTVHTTLVKVTIHITCQPLLECYS